MKKLLFAASVIVAFTVIGCKTSSSDPKGVLNAFFEALGKKDIATAKKLATKESSMMLGIIEMGMKMGGTETDKGLAKFDKSKMQFGEPKIDGETCIIPTTIKDNNETNTVNFPLKKEDGEWKVSFDMSILSANKDLIDSKMSADSTGQKRRLSDINMDSLQEASKKVMEELQKIDPEKLKELSKEFEKLKQK